MIKKVIILLVLGAAALGGGFYTRFVQEGGFPVPILDKAIESLLMMRAFKSTGAITATQVAAPGAASSSMFVQPFAIQFTLDKDTTDAKRSKTAFSLSTEVPQYPGMMSSINSGYIKLEGLTIGSDVYLRLNAFPQAIIDLTPFINKWVSWSLPEAAKTYGPAEVQVIPTAEQMKELRSRFIAARIFRFTRLLPDTEASDATLHHYEFILDKERAIAFIPVFTSWIESLTGEKISGVEEAQIKSIVSTMNSVPAEEYPTGEAHIGRDDGLMHRFVIKLPFRRGTAPPDVIVSLDVSLRDYNQPIVLEAPKGAVSLQGIIDAVMKQKNKQPITLAYNEALDWFDSLSKGATADFEAAGELIRKRYDVSVMSRANYTTGLSCSSYILEIATSKLTKAELNALRTKKAALSEIASDLEKSKTDDAALRKDIAASFERLVVMPEIISEKGFARVAEIDKSAPSVAPGASRAACQNMPVPAKYK